MCVCGAEDTVVAVSVTGILKVWIITAEVSRMQVYALTQHTLAETQHFKSPRVSYSVCVVGV